MRAAKIITWIGLGLMTFGLMNGFINGNLISDGKILLQNPWGVMSIIDLYVGFILFSMWIVYREKNIGLSIIWTISMMILGFFAACVYILIELYKSKGDWNKFFMGYRSI